MCSLSIRFRISDQYQPDASPYQSQIRKKEFLLSRILSSMLYIPDHCNGKICSTNFQVHTVEATVSFQWDDSSLSDNAHIHVHTPGNKYQYNLPFSALPIHLLLLQVTCCHLKFHNQTLRWFHAPAQSHHLLHPAFLLFLWDLLPLLRNARCYGRHWYFLWLEPTDRNR